MRIGIIGGGISGLTSAWLLKKKGFDVVVFEKEKVAGGNVRSEKVDGYILERGPYAFLKSSRWVWRLIYEAGLENYLVRSTPLASHRFIFRDGKLRKLPEGFFSFLFGGWLSAGGKIRILFEPFVKPSPDERETAWQFFKRRFGIEFTEYVASSFASGVYAGDLRKLGANSAFSKFWSFEKNHGSMIRGAIYYMREMKKREKVEGITPRKGMWSFKGGIGFLTNWLYNQLSHHIYTSCEVKTIERKEDSLIIKSSTGEFKCDRVIVAVPPCEAGNILEGSYPEAGLILKSIPMSPVILVQWTPDSVEKEPFTKGFGFLIPPLYGKKSLGTIFYSCIFPQLSQEGRPKLYGTFIGGALNPDVISLSDDEILNTMLCEQAEIAEEKTIKLSFVNIIRHPRAIAQLLPGHIENINRVREILREHNRVFLAGSFIYGVGMDYAVESGYAAANEIESLLNG